VKLALRCIVTCNETVIQLNPQIRSLYY